MALPQKVADRLARAPTQTPGGFRQLFFLASVLFFISLGFYVGLDFGYRPFLEGSVEELKNRLNEQANELPVEEQLEITNFYSQVVNLQKLLASHKAVSPLFSWLEKNTQVNVFYSNFSFQASNSKLLLSGAAKSIKDLSEQILVFESLPEIQNIKIGSISAEKELWVFDVELVLSSNFFKKISESE